MWIYKSNCTSALILYIRQPLQLHGLARHAHYVLQGRAGLSIACLIFLHRMPQDLRKLAACRPVLLHMR